VLVVPAGPVELATAGDQLQRRPPVLGHDAVPRERVLPDLLDRRHPVGELVAVALLDDHLVAGGELVQPSENPRLALAAVRVEAVDVPGDHRGPGLAWFPFVAVDVGAGAGVPAGLLGPLHRWDVEGAVGGEPEGYERRV